MIMQMRSQYHKPNTKEVIPLRSRCFRFIATRSCARHHRQMTATALHKLRNNCSEKARNKKKRLPEISCASCLHLLCFSPRSAKRVACLLARSICTYLRRLAHVAATIVRFVSTTCVRFACLVRLRIRHLGARSGSWVKV